MDSAVMKKYFNLAAKQLGFAFERSCWWIHFLLIEVHQKRQIQLR